MRPVNAVCGILAIAIVLMGGWLVWIGGASREGAEQRGVVAGVTVTEFDNKAGQHCTVAKSAQGVAIDCDEVRR